MEDIVAEVLARDDNPKRGMTTQYGNDGMIKGVRIHGKT